MITTKKSDNWRKEINELKKSNLSESLRREFVISVYDQILNLTMDSHLLRLARAMGKSTISLLTAEEMDQYIESDGEVREMDLMYRSRNQAARPVVNNCWNKFFDFISNNLFFFKHELLFSNLKIIHNLHCICIILLYFG